MTKIENFLPTLVIKFDKTDDSLKPQAHTMDYIQYSRLQNLVHLYTLSDVVPGFLGLLTMSPIIPNYCHPCAGVG